MMKKKLLSLCLAGAMLLAGCAGKPSGTAPSAAPGSDAAAASQQQSAANYPKYAVSVNTSKAGSNVDYIARAWAKSANQYFGANLIVNSTAGQIDAVRDTISADPDGYTLCVVNNTVVINDVVGQTDFDAIKDVRLISTIGSNLSNWIGIKTSLAEKGNIKTLDDLIAYTKAHPGELIISDRTASNTNTAVKMLMGVGLDVVPADVGTSTDRLTNFLSGNCDVFIGSYGLIEQYIETGDVICLAVMSSERSAFSPDVPCTGELGYAELGCPATYYLCGPKDLPDEVVTILEALCEKTIADSQYVADIAANTIEPFYANSADTVAFLSGLKEEMIALGMGAGYQAK